MAPPGIHAIPTTSPLHAERAHRRPSACLFSGAALRVSHGVVRFENGAELGDLSVRTVCASRCAQRAHQKDHPDAFFHCTEPHIVTSRFRNCFSPPLCVHRSTLAR